jgi:DNA-binding LacI/PurR family transcriptional regulator
LDSFAELRTRAGVSIKTVSRVVNDQGKISEATRQRVLAAIEELGYRPDVLARGLVSGKTLPVGLIIPQITGPFSPEVVQGVESVARRHGYSVFLCNTDEDPQQELEYVEVLAAKQVDGFILCSSRLEMEQLSQVASQHRVSILTNRKSRASLATPTLTTMRVPRYELGEMVMELPLRVIEADGDYEERLQVRPELVVRESCGARGDAATKPET